MQHIHLQNDSGFSTFWTMRQKNQIFDRNFCYEMTLDNDIEGKSVKIEKKVNSFPRDFNSLPISEKNVFFHKVLSLVSSCCFGHFWLCAEISAVEPLLLELGHASSV